MATVVHANLTRADLHEDKRVKQPARAASTGNVSLTVPGATLDGVTLVNGDRILLNAQTAPAENGIYVWTGAGTALTRATDASAAADFVFGFKVYAREGTTNAATYWTFTQSAAVTLGTTALTFAKDGTAFGSQTANTVYAGPASGGAATPAFRPVVAADLPVFVASGASHASGAVPDPGASAGTTRFLREDSTFAVPPGSGIGTGGGTSGGGALQAIQVVGPIGSAQPNASFGSIPAGFRNLRIKWQARGDTAATSTAMQLQFNGDTTAKYDRQLAFGQGSTAGAVESLTQTSMSVGEITASTSTAGSAASGEIDIVNYIGTTYRKQVTAHNALKRGADGTTSTFLNEMWAGEWRNTAAITSILLFPTAGNFDVGSYFVLYGELDTAAQSATAAAITTGGTITTSGVAEARVAPAGAVTGNILQAGTYGAQEITVTNEAVAANSITFAASGTSNVADGTSDVIAGLTARKFVWNSATSLWYRNA